MTFDKKIVVLGSGAYGTALALHWHKKEKDVTLIARTKEKAEHLTKKNENTPYLKDVPLDSLAVSSDLTHLKKANVIVIAIPSQAFSNYIEGIKDFINPNALVVIASKGVDLKTVSFLKDVFEKVCKNPVSVWSGPQFAREVATLLPSAVTLSSDKEDTLYTLIEILSTDRLRIYPSLDSIAVQLSGALKNAIAIACGIARGLNLGENTIAALQTRGLAEIRRLGVKMGANPETFWGLSGMGDLVLTCSSLTSRNTQFGMKIATKGVDCVLSSPHPLAEGIYAIKAAYMLSQKFGVYMPISHSLYRLLYENDTLEELITNLLTKPTHKETL